MRLVDLIMKKIDNKMERVYYRYGAEANRIELGFKAYKELIHQGAPIRIYEDGFYRYKGVRVYVDYSDEYKVKVGVVI